MRVVIRTDASPTIGTGHVMRCLCLADELHARGASVCFAKRALPEHLAQMVVAHGHRIVPLPDDAAAHEMLDAEQTLAACGPCDWIVVDHYALGTDWETEVRGTSRLLVIDDLARPHWCDVLLDQNFHPEPPLRYAGRVPDDCLLLLGPRYALLRPEFAQARRRVEPRDGKVRRLLVALGGIDADNITEKVLRAIALADRAYLSVDVVIGASHPARERIQTLCAALPDARCHIQTSEMAALLADADLAVGAGGTSTWERCAMGVPTLGLCLADNQRDVLFYGSRYGFIYSFDAAADDFSALALHLCALLDNSGLRQHLSRTGLELVDARGAQRVAAALIEPSITIRRATLDDSRSLHAWRNDQMIRAASRDPSTIHYAEHERWLRGVLDSSSRYLLVGERDGLSVGVVRFDVSDAAAEVSIYLKPDRIGKGEGTGLLLAAEAWIKRERPNVWTLYAEVNAHNMPSQRLFERSGYDLCSTRYTKRTRT